MSLIAKDPCMPSRSTSVRLTDCSQVDLGGGANLSSDRLARFCQARLLTFLKLEFWCFGALVVLRCVGGFMGVKHSSVTLEQN